MQNKLIVRTPSEFHKTHSDYAWQLYPPTAHWYYNGHYKFDLDHCNTVRLILLLIILPANTKLF